MLPEKIIQTICAKTATNREINLLFKRIGDAYKTSHQIGFLLEQIKKAPKEMVPEYKKRINKLIDSEIKLENEILIKTNNLFHSIGESSFVNISVNTICETAFKIGRSCSTTTEEHAAFKNDCNRELIELYEEIKSYENRD